MGKGVFLLCLLFLHLPAICLPEGTKQIAPNASAEGNLCIDKSRNNFGFYDAPPEFRLNIYIANPSEMIRFGLGRVSNPSNFVEVAFRVKDPSGNIILGPLPVPRSGQGFISTYSQAVAGPLPSVGGYDPIPVNVTGTGNYCLEFYYAPNQWSKYDEGGRIEFEQFDITVLNTANLPIPGRVWSKAWQFNCGPVTEPPTNNRFYGTMFILSDDSIVTSINCNGFVGGTFSISSNRTGCSTTGDITIDRQSRTGFHTYPQYKVFLSEPDSLVFPTGKALSGITLPISITNQCASGSVDFGIKVQQDGVIEILIEVDPQPGANPLDVTLTANVLANPGGNGINTIRWNGIDGQGNPVSHGSAVTATLRFIHGITHLPIYDIEYNDNGYIVEVIRPHGPKPDIFWDDSLLPNGSSVNLNGCNDPMGCHLWEIHSGDTNTINSWWYVGSSTMPSMSFTLKRSPGKPGAITGETSFCNGGIIREYVSGKGTNAESYQWSYSGNGASITGNDTLATISFDTLATSGMLSVAGYNLDCGVGQVSTLPVNFYPSPQVTLTLDDTICINESPYLLLSGSPSGGVYLLDGLSATTFDPALSGTGSHQLIYRYQDMHGCSNSDTAAIVVTNGRDCELHLWVPNAFTPDGDGLNDLFKPVSMNIRKFSMAIYNRNGETVFSTDDPEKGWDGRYMGEYCPADSYIYVIVYRSSHSPPEDTTLTGHLVLVR